MSSSTTNPIPMAMAVRPASASESERLRSPGATQDQKMRSPTPAATNRHVSSSSPCGVISPKKRSARPWLIMIEPVTARLRIF
ncbi:Uncharacterised protein [Mycobacteroides abscessus subsp. abscessus]|nr:Uncharacterised protein [Mycobacteroides abscessus subsp. abscessus]